MAFAMQIVTPLIGGKGLGLEVFNGLARSDTGRGLAAGIGIVLLAIIIDRITLAYTKKQRQALGLFSHLLRDLAIFCPVYICIYFDLKYVFKY